MARLSAEQMKALVAALERSGHHTLSPADWHLLQFAADPRQYGDRPPPAAAGRLSRRARVELLRRRQQEGKEIFCPLDGAGGQVLADGEAGRTRAGPRGKKAAS